MVNCEHHGLGLWPLTKLIRRAVLLQMMVMEERGMPKKEENFSEVTGVSSSAHRKPHRERGLEWTGT